jgi:hypothetical protein
MYAALTGSVVTALLAAPIPLPEWLRPWLVVVSILATAVTTALVKNKPQEAQS